MGNAISYIELENISNIEAETLDGMEARLNELVLENRPVVVSVTRQDAENSACAAAEDIEKRSDFRQNDLPHDVAGAAVRYVELKGLEISPW
jgi:hypothetical protein